MPTTPSSPTPTPDPEDAWLEKLLREPMQPTTDPARRDDAEAFTTRVVAALPAPVAETQRKARRRRTTLILASTVLGVALTWAVGGPGLQQSVAETTHLIRSANAQPQVIESIVVHVLAGISAAAMLWFVGGRKLRRLF